jgi:hypothetical protein
MDLTAATIKTARAARNNENFAVREAEYLFAWEAEAIKNDATCRITTPAFVLET